MAVDKIWGKSVYWHPFCLVSQKEQRIMALSKTEVQKYKKRLEELKSQISTALTNCTAEVKKPDEATGYSQHQADQGTDDFDRRISLEVTSQEFQVLRLIERALEKMTEGTYGVCDISGEEIPKA